MAPDSRGGAALEVSGTVQDNGGFLFFTFLLQALIFSIIGFVRTTRMRHNDTVFYPALINLSMNMLYKGFILDPSLAKRTVNVILCIMTVHYQHCKNW